MDDQNASKEPMQDGQVQRVSVRVAFMNKVYLKRCGYCVGMQETR